MALLHMDTIEKELTSPSEDTITLGIAAQLWLAELGIKKWIAFPNSPAEPLLRHFFDVIVQTADDDDPS